MQLKGGEVIEFQINGVAKRWRISKIDGNVVKIFEEDGSYLQMSYKDFMGLMEDSNPKIDIPELY